MTKPNRQHLFASLAAATALAALPAWAQEAAKPVAPAKHPNIIFILTDDLGWGDLGVLYQNSRKKAGNRAEPWHSTPNLDLFAAQGAVLPHHYCPAPVCAPSRASLLLGVHQGHANVRNNQFDKALEANHTLATVTRQAGYATAAIGKWGLQGKGPGPDWEAHPLNRGFDYYYGYMKHVDGHEHYPKERPYRNKQEIQVWENRTDVVAGLDKCYTADLFTARAKQWIVDQEKANPAKPFFLYLAYDTPHATTELPTQPYPDGGGLKGGMQWLGKPGHMISTASGTIDSWIHPDYRDATYDHDSNPATPEIAWPNVYKRYATSVRRIDDAVGDLLQLLKDLKIDEDTLVVFASDNGPSQESYLKQPLEPSFFASFGPFDGIKRDCWEGGIRVPALVRWPGHVVAGRTFDQPTGSWDWLPTFAQAAGVPSPARTDGVSLLPGLTNTGIQDNRGFQYVEYNVDGRTPAYRQFDPSHRKRLRNQMQMIRLGDYLGVRYDIKSNADDFEIYNVVADPQEIKDLGKGPGSAAFQRQMKDKVLQVRRPDPDAPRPYDNELVPAGEKPVVSEAGVDTMWAKGTFPWVPELIALQRPDRENGEAVRPDPKATPDPLANQAILFSGYLQIPQDGEYTFGLSTDTGALLRLHEATVIDADYGYAAGTERTGTIKLKTGVHPFRLFYIHRGPGASSLEFTWTGPGIAKQPIPATAFLREVRIHK
jgi:arylsulfatase A-like enzyme